MNFIDTPMVNQSLDDIKMLQDRVIEYGSLYELTEDKLVHIELLHALHALIDKQMILYTRATLCGDESAKELKEDIEKVARTIFDDESVSVMERLQSCKEKVFNHLKEIDNEEDFDDYEGLL